MKFRKLNIRSVLLIALIIVLLILLLFLPNIINLIPDSRIKYGVTIVLSGLLFAYLLYLIYADLRNKQYVTTIYIVLSDIIIVLSFGVLAYTSFKRVDVKNIEALFLNFNMGLNAKLVLLCTTLLRSFLKSERFKKEKQIQQNIS